MVSVICPIMLIHDSYSVLFLFVFILFAAQKKLQNVSNKLQLKWREINITEFTESLLVIMTARVIFYCSVL